MQGKGLHIFRLLSLIALLAVTVTLEAARANSIVLPDQAVRLLGLLDIASVAILIFTSLKLFFRSREDR